MLEDELISGKLEDTGNYDTCGSYQLLKGNDGCWYAVLRYDQDYIKRKEAEAPILPMPRSPATLPSISSEPERGHQQRL